jgi:hypothetical protein
MSGVNQILSNPYVLLGLIFLIIAAVLVFMAANKRYDDE